MQYVGYCRPNFITLHLSAPFTQLVKQIPNSCNVKFVSLDAMENVTFMLFCMFTAS